MRQVIIELEDKWKVTFVHDIERALTEDSALPSKQYGSWFAAADAAREFLLEGE